MDLSAVSSLGFPMSPSGTFELSRGSIPIASLGEGLLGHPLQVMLDIIPQGFTKGVGRVTLEKLVEILIYYQLAVMALPLGFELIFFSLLIISCTLVSEHCEGSEPCC